MVELQTLGGVDRKGLDGPLRLDRRLGRIAIRRLGQPLGDPLETGETSALEAAHQLEALRHVRGLLPGLVAVPGGRLGAAHVLRFLENPGDGAGRRQPAREPDPGRHPVSRPLEPLRAVRAQRGRKLLRSGAEEVRKRSGGPAGPAQPDEVVAGERKESGAQEFHGPPVGVGTRQIAAKRAQIADFAGFEEVRALEQVGGDPQLLHGGTVDRKPGTGPRQEGDLLGFDPVFLDERRDPPGEAGGDVLVARGHPHRQRRSFRAPFLLRARRFGQEVVLVVTEGPVGLAIGLRALGDPV